MKIKVLNRNNEILDEALINYHINKVHEREINKQDIINFILQFKHEFREHDKIIIERN